MIPVRIQVRLEALTDQYFPGLAVHALRSCSFDSDTFDVYELEMEDGRTYWLFDDQQTLWPLAKSGIYEDAEIALEVIEQMRQNAQELQADAVSDRSELYQ